MKKVILVISLVIFCFCIPFSSYAILAGELTNVKIKNYHFTSRIIMDGEYLYSEDLTTGRFLVITVEADTPAKKTILFARDFALHYETTTQEKRATCQAIGLVSQDGIIDSLKFIKIDNQPGIKSNNPNITFALVFYVTNDIDKISLVRIGSKRMVELNLDPRCFSVYVVTNNLSRKEVSEACRSIKSGGFYVSSSNVLKDNVAGLVIFYMPGTKFAADDIASKLTKQFKHEILLVEMKNIDIGCTYDIMVWIGNDCKPKKRGL